MRKLSWKPNPFPLRPNGFTLIELMVVLTILAVTATILIKSSVGLQDQGRYDQTVDRVNKIKQAIVNVQTVNGVPTVSGFVADMGRLPFCLRELLDGKCNTTDIVFSWGVIGLCSGTTTTYTTQVKCPSSSTWSAIGSCVNAATGSTTLVDLATCNSAPGTWRQLTMSFGWNGPYLQTSNSPALSAYAFSDGWGTDYQINSAISQAACTDQNPSTDPNPSPSPWPPYQWVMDADNNYRCHQMDWSNYGWRFDSYDPSNQTTNANNYSTTYNNNDITTYNLLNLQSYGSDGIPDRLRTPTDQYQNDYPANQPFIHIQDWQFNLGSASLPSSNILQQLQTTSITINLQSQGFFYPVSMVSSVSGLSYPVSIVSSPIVGCSMSGGAWNGTSCDVTQSMCNILGGFWSPTNTCTLPSPSFSFTLPLQSLCVNARGFWNSGSNQCTLAMDQVNCNLLSGTFNSNAVPTSCTLTAKTFSGSVPATLEDTCKNLFLLGTPPSGVWSGTNCTLVAPGGGTPTPLTNFQGLCKALGGAWDSTSNQCTIGGPLLSLVTPQCYPTPNNFSYFCASSRNICLNIFYRDSRNASATTPIVVATAPSVIQSDGQPHAVSFSGFSVYDLSGGTVIDNSNPANPPLPVPIPVGQNAISVTQANSDGTCKATPGTPPVLPWTNPAYPANRPAGPVPQTFLPGLPLIFNW